MQDLTNEEILMFLEKRDDEKKKRYACNKKWRDSHKVEVAKYHKDYNAKKKAFEIHLDKLAKDRNVKL